MSEDYDPKTGRWSTSPSPGVLPRYTVNIEEERQTWESKDPQWQDDLPESPPYDRVAGDNIIHKDVAYKMIHTGRRWVRERPGSVWGKLDIQSADPITLEAGATEHVMTQQGWGWILRVYFWVKNPHISLNLAADGNWISLGDGTPQNIYEYWQHNDPGYPWSVARYDSKYDNYALEFHPDPPFYFGSKVEIEVENNTDISGEVEVVDLVTRLNPHERD